MVYYAPVTAVEQTPVDCLSESTVLAYASGLLTPGARALANRHVDVAPDLKQVGLHLGASLRVQGPEGFVHQ